MGLDKKKPILVREQFEVDPFKPDNQVLSSQSRSSLPTSTDDVVLDRNQSVYYSVEYVLKRLLQNDKFIDEFLSKSRDQIKLAVNQGLLTSQNVDESILAPNDTHIYPSYFNLHEYEYHGAKGSTYDQYRDAGVVSATCMLSAVARDYVDSDMSNFDENAALSAFQKRSTDTASHIGKGVSETNDITISNDVVVEVEYNDSPNVYKATNFVNVSVSNSKTKFKFKQSMTEQVLSLNAIPKLTECTYIYKRWLSGLKEIYIYLPTTFTFYQQNESGEDINKNATWICVKLNKRHFNLHHIYQAYICGQSLPMQIHNTDASIKTYNDVVLPSMLRSMCTSEDIDQNVDMVYDSYNAQYVLYFVCYGTDAQAIRIFGD